MFRIPEVFIEDRKLAEFLKAASGLVAQMGVPQPVVNLNARTVTLKRLKPKKLTVDGLRAETNGNLADMYLNYLVVAGKKEFKPADVKDYLASVGKSRLSYSYIITKLKEYKAVKPLKEGFGYQVTHAGEQQVEQQQQAE